MKNCKCGCGGDKRCHADIMASRNLANANEASERGDHATAERLYAKSQYWLDRYNILAGNA